MGTVSAIKSGTLAQVISEIGSDTRTLTIFSSEAVSVNLTIPSNVTLEFTREGVIQITAGVQLTIQGSIIAPEKQIFSFADATATLSYSGNTVLNVQWFGATGDGSTDDTTAFQHAAATFASETSLFIPPGDYLLTGAISFSGLIEGGSILGAGVGATNLIINGNLTSSLIDLGGPDPSYADRMSGCEVGQFTIWGSKAHKEDKIQRLNTVTTAALNCIAIGKGYIHHINFEGIKGTALRIVRCIRHHISDLEFSYCGDTNKPTLYQNAGLWADNEVTQGTLFTSFGMEHNYNSDVWVSDSPGGAGDGSGQNWYENIRWENGPSVHIMFSQIIEGPGGASFEVGEVVDAAPSGASFTVQAIGEAAGELDAIRFDYSTETGTVTTADTLTGQNSQAVGTISAIDRANGQYMKIDDRGNCRFTNLHINRCLQRTSGESAIELKSGRNILTSLKISGIHPTGAGLELNSSSYNTITNVMGTGADTYTEAIPLIHVHTSSDNNVISNITMYEFGGIKITGTACNYNSISDVTIYEPGDVTPVLIDTDLHYNTLSNIVVDSGDDIGTSVPIPVFSVKGNFCRVRDCFVHSCNNASSAYEINGGDCIISGCHAIGMDNSNGVEVSDNHSSVLNCQFYNLGKHGILVNDGANPNIISGNEIRKVGTLAASTYAGIRLVGTAARTLGLIVSDNHFDLEGGQAQYDIHADSYWKNVTYANNCTASGVGVSCFGGTAPIEVTQSMLKAVTTTDATATTVWSQTLDDESVYYVKAAVVAQKSDGTQRALYKRGVLVYRDAGGGATIQGNVVDDGTIESDADWNCTLDTATNDVRLRVTGKAATTVHWSADINMTRIEGTA